MNDSEQANQSHKNVDHQRSSPSINPLMNSSFTNSKCQNQTDTVPSKHELYQRLEQLRYADQQRFRRRLSKAKTAKALNAISDDLDKAAAIIPAIEQHIPTIDFPGTLPVSQSVDEIAEAITENQVVVIAGETGSGKTTQIPKICLQLGRGRYGLIGHTQPRRLAARTVAERISDELNQKIGQSVGYAIRFDDRVGKNAAVKLMTDGILLAELQRDPYLYAYDTIIIDEAHERSLNIDFLLGYLKRLLPKRPDLKVIITSATIDPQSFAEHFRDPKTHKPAPVIEVSGRTYPVEVRYQPLEIEVDGKTVAIDPLDGLCTAAEQLLAEGNGDILCFFPGEREIRDAQEALEKKRFRGVEIVPLFGRLSNQEQHRVFAPHSKRRIVLATNIAETSLTVPGIHYVIDTGTARISRYSTRTKVQRLPIEPISQASANQRAGRCGRIADGIAIRLYSEEDFFSRPEFTDPEILRTNLASVILQMSALRLGAVADFPFVQSPEHKAVRDGLVLLSELDAIDSTANSDSAPQLTKIGKQLARIPVDPRLARMLVEAERLECLQPVIVIVAAMTLQDVRERPLEQQQQADQAHARFRSRSSDFLGLLSLWGYITEQRAELSGNQFRKRMKEEFLHFMRIREWFDLVRQLQDIALDLKWTISNNKDKQHGGISITDGKFSGDSSAIHRALLTGLLSNIGSRVSDSAEFQGARGTRFMIFPGSGVAKKPPELLMASELVETSKLFARGVAAIEPSWVETAARSLLKHQYSDPSWSYKRGAAVATQRSTLYGVPIVADRTISYHRVDPEAARAMFIQHALIAGEWKTSHKFFHQNLEKLSTAGEYEEKARRRGIIVDEDTLFEFYDQRIPNSVTHSKAFDGWWKKARRKQPNLLDFDPDKLLTDGASAVTEQDFPNHWRHGGLDLELTYLFEPGHRRDGITVNIPVPMLANVDPEPFEWLVPGLREELVTELIRSLPKALRRSLVPAPDFAAQAIDHLLPYETDLLQQVAEAFHQIGARGINASDFSPEKLPPHLHMTFAAIDKRGKIIDDDKDLSALQQRQAGKISASITKKMENRVQQSQNSSQTDARPRMHTTQRTYVSAWTKENLGTIPEQIEHEVDNHLVTAYPALTINEQGLSVQYYPTRAAADTAMMTATLTLLLRSLSVNTQKMVNGLPLQQRVAVEHCPHGGADGLVADARIAALRDLLIAEGGPVRSPDEFEKLKAAIGGKLPREVRQAVVTLAPGLVRYSALADELSNWEGPAIDDMRGQLDFLFPKQAISTHGIQQLRHLPRYLRAIEIRLSDMTTAPDKDGERQDIIDDCHAYLENRLRRLPSGAERSSAVAKIRWMIEELRVSLFAQRLGTAHPVSARRIHKAIDAVGKNSPTKSQK